LSFVLRVGILDAVMDLASSKKFGSLKVKKAKIAIGERRDHVGLELVHCDMDALLLGHDELLGVLDVVHIPELNVAVR